METRHHDKNGATPKSQMSRTENFIIMKSKLFFLFFVLLALTSCSQNCGDRFIGKVWYSDKGIAFSFQDTNSKGSSTIIMKVEKENETFFVYYWDRSGKENVDKFVVTCDGNVLNGQYNGQNVILSISENGDLLINQYKIQSAGNILKEWNKNKTQKDEDELYNNFEHSQFASFLLLYDLFKSNNKAWENNKDEFYDEYHASKAKEYNTENTGDIGIGKDKVINKKYRDDIIKKIEQNEY